MRWLRRDNLILPHSLLWQGLTSGRMRPPHWSAAAAAALRYFTKSDRPDGWPNDPVARFHLGNGAILENIHFGADKSVKGMAQAGGVMVNYRYDLDIVEANHEAFQKTKSVPFIDAQESAEILTSVMAGDSACHKCFKLKAGSVLIGTGTRLVRPTFTCTNRPCAAARSAGTSPVDGAKRPIS